MTECYFVEIQERPEGFQLTVHQGDSHRPLVSASVSMEEKTPIGDGAITLGGLVSRLIQGDVGFLSSGFHERLQLDTGSYLYKETFGRLDLEPPTEGDVRVHIVTNHEYIARLPWMLLARNGQFLSASGWAISMSRSGQKDERCLLPPSPKILIVAPQPTGVDETDAKAHLEDIEFLLSAADHHFERGKHLRVTTTWKGFQRDVEEFQPHVVYFYGHGKGDTRTTRLVFSEEKANQRYDVPVADVAQCLRRLCDRPPILAYVNCCLGDAGGQLGVGWQLGAIVPAVVTNHTVASVTAAQRQALHFWRAVLVSGQPPHRTLAEMYSHLGNMGLSFRDARWMTPVLHSHYSHWESHPPRPRNHIDDPHWRVKLDRVQQFAQVVFQTQKMLNELKPPCLAYLWYGETGQGVDLFHQRLQVELRDFLRDNHLYEVRPHWPDELSHAYRSFEDMMLEAFELNSLDDIPAWIRAQTKGESGRHTVVYIRHEPLERGDVFRPEHLQHYLEWWDDVFVPKIQESPAFGLLGVSFIVKHPSRFLKMLHKKALHEPELHRVVFYVLDELERLTRKDLTDFLHTHNIMLPRGHKDRILEEILEETGGHYEMTLAALRDIVYRGWDERAVEELDEDTQIDW